MTSSKHFTVASVVSVIAVAAAAIFVSAALGARPKPTLSFVVHNRGLEFVTAAGPTTHYPGHLQIGDRIFSRDALTQGTHSVGYGNELCTVTFDNHELCQETVVLPGRGQLEASWLWTHWPSGFTGVIDGGTGTFVHTKGEFTATPLAGGVLSLTATLN